MKKATETKREKLIIDILTDAVIFSKVSNMICDLSGGYFDLETKYNGYTNAAALLEIPIPFDNEDPLHLIHETLCDIFLNNVNWDSKQDKEEQKKPIEVAKLILKEWRNFLSYPTIKIDLEKINKS